MGVKTELDYVEYPTDALAQADYTCSLGNLISCWEQKAPKLTYNSVVGLCVYNGEIYGGTSNGELVKWNGVDAWVVMAATLTPTYAANNLIVYNNKLYATHLNALLEWNDVDTWVVVGSAPSATYFGRTIVYNDKLYIGSSNKDYWGQGGSLFVWNDVNAVTSVASLLNTQNGIGSLCVYNDKIYAGTIPTGRLFEWNGINAWIQVAPQLNGQIYIKALAVYNNKLYGGTWVGGKLFEWNDVDAWLEKADLVSSGQINDLLVFHDELYAATANNGTLIKWNNVDAWIQVAPQLNSQATINSLVEYNNKLYGGTYNWSNGGRLFRYNDGNRVYFEDVIINQGLYSIQSVSESTDIINGTWTKTISPLVSLEISSYVKFHIRSERTGTNIRFLLHDSVGGTIISHDINIVSANTWQEEIIDITAIDILNKSNIDQLQFQVLNTDSDDLFYFDNIYGEALEATTTNTVTNRKSLTVTLNGTLTNTGGYDNLYLWFEYWKDEVGAEHFTTTKQTLTELGTFDENISGLTEDTNYKYKAMVSEAASGADEEEGNEVSFKTKLTINNIVSESISLSESHNKTMNFNLLETDFVSLSEESTIKRVLLLPLLETITITDLKDLKLNFNLSESMLLADTKLLTLRTCVSEDLSLAYGHKRIMVDPVETWIIAKPVNTNSSFADDTNSDGIADQWVNANIDSDDTTIMRDGCRFSVQKIGWASGGYIKQTHTLSGVHRVVFEIKPTSVSYFEIKQSGVSIYKKKFPASDAWQDFLMDFDFSGSIEFKFYQDYGTTYFDNFAIIQYNPYIYDIEKHKKLAPQSFSYKLTGDDVVETLLDRQFVDKKITSDYTINWNLIKHTQQVWAEDLVGETIIIRTSAKEIFSFLVTEIIHPYSHFVQGLEQNYSLQLGVKEL